MRMTMGQLRRIIRETIEEETRHSVNEGFMDSVKGLFGGGTKGAAKMYRKNLRDMFHSDKYKGSSGGDWWEMSQGIQKDFGRTVQKKFQNILSNSDGISCAGFYDAFLRAIYEVLKDPAALIGQSGGIYEDYFLEGAEALKKGDMKSAKYNLQQLLDNGIENLWNAFKAEPLAGPYLAAAKEASDTERRIDSDVKAAQRHATAMKERDKRDAISAINRNYEDTRGLKAKEKEKTREFYRDTEFKDKQRK